MIIPSCRLVNSGPIIFFEKPASRLQRMAKIMAEIKWLCAMDAMLKSVPSSLIVHVIGMSWDGKVVYQEHMDRTDGERAGSSNRG